jgi:hypothetical protein
MTENEKPIPVETAETKPADKTDTKTKPEKATEAKAKKTESKPDGQPAKTAPVQPNKPRPRRGGLLGGSTHPAQLPVDLLARRTGTDAVVLGALKAAYGWTDRTRMTQADFLRLREAWLKRPVKEG